MLDVACQTDPVRVMSMSGDELIWFNRAMTIYNSLLQKQEEEGMEEKKEVTEVKEPEKPAVKNN